MSTTKEGFRAWLLHKPPILPLISLFVGWLLALLCILADPASDLKNAQMLEVGRSSAIAYYGLISGS